MSFQLERKLIETAFKGGMPAGSVISFNNVPFTGATDSWTRISVLSGGEGRRIEITPASPVRTHGLIDVGIFTKPDVGTAQARVIADYVATALAYKSFSERLTRITTFGARLDLIGRSGDWFQANVTIRFENDTSVTTPSPVGDFSGDDFSDSDFATGALTQPTDFSASDYSPNDFSAAPA